MKRLFVVSLTLMVFSFLILSNIATADDLILGCKHKQNGKLRIVQNSGECKNTEILISWNKQGPQGEQGPPGEQGLQGSPGIPGPPGGEPPIAFINGTVEIDDSQTIYTALSFGAYLQEASPGGGRYGDGVFEGVMLIMPADNPLFPELMLNAATKTVMEVVKIYLGASTLDFLILHNAVATQIEIVPSSQNNTLTQYAISLEPEEFEFYWGQGNLIWNFNQDATDGCEQGDTNFIDDINSNPLQGYTPISFFSFGVQSPRGARPNLDTLKVSMDVTDVSPCFLNNLADKRIISEVKIEKWVGDAEQIKIVLENVLTVDFKFFPTTNGIPAVELEFDYEKATLTHYQYDSLGNPHETTVELNTEAP